MDLSTFLALFLGGFMLIFGVIWLLRREEINQAFKELASSKGWVLMAGEMNLLGGIAILIGHPYWEFSWVGLITVLGLLMFFKGIMYITSPAKTQEVILKILDNRSWYWVNVSILILLGAILTYSGFAIA